MIGIPVQVTTLLTTQVAVIDYDRPKRRHRKRLIAKRWAKRFGYHTKMVEVERSPFFAGGVLYMGPKTFAELKKSVQEHKKWWCKP